jgi:hypothetical protein
MPNRFIKSVMAKAGICCAMAAVTASPKRVMPSVMENSEWRRRWIKAGVFIRAFYQNARIALGLNNNRDLKDWQN